MYFWHIVHYGWFAFMALAILSVIGASVWETTAPKRRLKQLAREKARRELEAAQAAAAAEQAAEGDQVADASAGQEPALEATVAATNEPTVQDASVPAE
jgi:heme exporter protein D